MSRVTHDEREWPLTVMISSLHITTARSCSVAIRFLAYSNLCESLLQAESDHCVWIFLNWSHRILTVVKMVGTGDSR